MIDIKTLSLAQEPYEHSPINNYRIENPNPLFPETQTRKIPYNLRSGFRDELLEMCIHHKELLESIIPLIIQQKLDGKPLSCPLCGNNHSVKSHGSQKDGTKKFICYADHTNCKTQSENPFIITMHKNWKGNFSTYTSLEAYQLYRQLIVESIVLFINTNSTIEGLSKHLGVSRKFIETSLIMALLVLKDEKTEIKLEGEEDFVIVYMDFSGAILSKRFSLVLAKINGQSFWKIAVGSNYLTAWDFINTIKNLAEEKQRDKEIKWIFITDGELCFVDPIGKLFPKSVHIRQFHKKELRGLVYVHFPVDSESLQEFGYKDIKSDRGTLSLNWDAVLDEGEACKRTKAQRERRKKKKSEYENNKNRKNKNADEEKEILDKDIKFYPYVKNSHRRKTTKNSKNKQSKSSKRFVGEEDSTAESQRDSTERSPRSPLLCGEPRTSNSIDNKKSNEDIKNEDISAPPQAQVKSENSQITSENCSKERNEKTASTYCLQPKKETKKVFKSKRKSKPKPKPIVFKTVSEAKEHPILAQLFAILVMIFGGLYIQSNSVENGFNVKISFKQHRVMKNGKKMLTLLLYSQLKLKSMSTSELRKFFLERISTEMVMSFVIPRDSSVREMKRKQDEIVQLVYRALETKCMLSIAYVDYYGNFTRRGIIVERFDGKYIDAFCLLKNKPRWFRIDRINAAYLDEEKPLMLPCA